MIDMAVVAKVVESAKKVYPEQRKSYVAQAKAMLATGETQGQTVETVEAIIAAVEAIDAPVDAPAPVVPPANTVRVSVDKANFAKGVKYAKQFGGRFDGDTKTWLIPASRPELGNIRAYGLVRVVEQ